MSQFTSRQLSTSTANRCGDHFQDATESVVAAHAAFVERRAGDWFPVVARAVVIERLRNAGQFRRVLAVVAAKFVNDEIERRNDEDSETARAGLVKRVTRRAGDVTIGVVFELQTEWR